MAKIRYSNDCGTSFCSASSKCARRTKSSFLPKIIYAPTFPNSLVAAWKKTSAASPLTTSAKDDAAKSISSSWVTGCSDLLKPDSIANTLFSLSGNEPACYTKNIGSSSSSGVMCTPFEGSFVSASAALCSLPAQCMTSTSGSDR